MASIHKNSSSTLKTYKGSHSRFILYKFLAEQRKIGAFFHALDALTDARREKVEKFQCLKKVFLERMFP